MTQGDRTIRAVDGDVAHGPHGAAENRWGEDAVLGEEPHEAAPLAADEPDEEEVEEAHVVAGEDGAALSREVVRAAHLDAQAEHREDDERRADDEAVGPVGHTSSSSRERVRMARHSHAGRTRPLVLGAGPLAGLLAGSDETRLTPALKRELACV